MTLFATFVRTALLACGAIAAILTAFAQPDSPFLPPAGATAAAPAQETLQLSGVIASGKSILVNLTDTQTKLSLWIPVGGGAEDIDVVSFDAATDTAVVRVKGDVKNLKLRAPTIVSAPIVAPASPAASAIGTSPAAVEPLLTQADQEREARMLVSDLLEIGLQQRKAYEEARRKAAAESKKK